MPDAMPSTAPIRVDNRFALHSNHDECGPHSRNLISSRGLFESHATLSLFDDLSPPTVFISLSMALFWGFSYSFYCASLLHLFLFYPNVAWNNILNMVQGGTLSLSFSMQAYIICLSWS